MATLRPPQTGPGAQKNIFVALSQRMVSEFETAIYTTHNCLPPFKRFLLKNQRKFVRTGFRSGG
ncbi:MAG: hypothetical protein KDJ30_02165 [Rhodoblastus sp.]|nr:hypothetical protein [Rhodoblastus sp.]